MFKSIDSYIVGYYGMHNSGDDALMLAAILGAQSQLKSKRTAVNASSDNYVAHSTGCITQQSVLFRGHQRLKHYQRAMSAKHVIFGGGSVLHSQRDIALKRHMIALSGRKQAMALGVGIEAFHTTADERQCALFLNECGLVGVRDENSYNIARAIAPNANIKHTFDLAPSLLHYLGDHIKPIERQGIALNFCPQAVNAFADVDQNVEAKRVANAVELIRAVWALTQEDIYLIDFNGHGQFGDHTVHKKVIAQLPDYIPVRHVAYDANPIRVLQRMAMFKACIGMRLHAAIFAYMVDTPFLSLQYHKKCQQWCEQVGVHSSYQFDANDYCPETIASAVSRGLAHAFSAPTLNVASAVNLSMKNWSDDYERNSVHGCYPAVQ